MNQNWIFIPALMQVSLTLIVFIMLNAAKSKALTLGQVDEERRALHTDAWPEYVLKISNNIGNQFETPVLFYALGFILWALNAVDSFAIVLAWGYVITRILHAYIHIGSNYVPLRRRVFTIGTMLLLLMTILCFSKVIAALM